MGDGTRTFRYPRRRGLDRGRRGTGGRGEAGPGVVGYFVFRLKWSLWVPSGCSLRKGGSCSGPPAHTGLATYVAGRRISTRRLRRAGVPTTTGPTGVVAASGPRPGVASTASTPPGPVGSGSTTRGSATTARDSGRRATPRPAAGHRPCGSSGGTTSATSTTISVSLSLTSGGLSTRRGAVTPTGPGTTFGSPTSSPSVRDPAAVSCRPRRPGSRTGPGARGVGGRSPRGATRAPSRTPTRTPVSSPTSGPCGGRRYH